MPNGAIVVKEQYQSQTAPLFEWTVMVKDSKLSWDGWYWADLVNPSAAQSERGADAVAGRWMRRTAGPVQRCGLVLSELPRVGDRE